MQVQLINNLENDKFVTELDFSTELESAFKIICKDLKQKFKKLSVNVIYIDSDKMQEINLKERQKDSVTDVLSFPSLSLSAGQKIKLKEHAQYYDKTEKTLSIGDILICVKRADEQSKDFGHSLKREIVYLAVHGMLHCFGFDHENDSEKKIMRAAEEYVLNKLNILRESN